MHVANGSPNIILVSESRSFVLIRASRGLELVPRWELSMVHECFAPEMEHTCMSFRPGLVEDRSPWLGT